MKGLLCLVILIASGTAGVTLSGAYRRRVRALTQLLLELRRLEEHVRRMRPLKQALMEMDSLIIRAMHPHLGAPDPAAEWLKLCEAAPENDLCGALDMPERRTMAHFWAELGTMDMHRQLNRFAETRASLEAVREEAVQEADGHSRLYASLGILLGLGTVILLW